LETLINTHMPYCKISFCSSVLRTFRHDHGLEDATNPCCRSVLQTDHACDYSSLHHPRTAPAYCSSILGRHVYQFGLKLIFFIIIDWISASCVHFFFNSLRLYYNIKFNMRDRTYFPKKMINQFWKVGSILARNVTPVWRWWLGTYCSWHSCFWGFVRNYIEFEFRSRNVGGKRYKWT
jgi:hypothetical protein